MDVVYVYAGGRDETLERDIREMIPGSRQRSALPGMDGFTEVVLAVPDGGEEAAVRRLRVWSKVVDAARSSLGEGA